MSGTMTNITGITHSNGSLSVPMPSKTKTITQAGQGVFTDTQSISHSAPVAVTIGSTSTLGLVAIENIDSANFVDFGSYVSSVFYPLVRLLFGERYVFRVKPGLTLYAQADTAAVKIQKTIYEA